MITKEIANRTVALGIALVTSGIVSACSSHQESVSSQPAPLPPGVQGSALGSGSVSVAGPVPGIEPLSTLLESAHALGFIPVEAAHDGKWLSIETSTGTMRLMDGTEQIHAAQADGAKTLPPGTYSLQHKQRSALWHAPDQYFTARGLKVPGVGDRERFLRGALGEFSLFLNKSTPIHCGPIASSEIGGIRVNEDELSKIYYSLEVGAPIEIKP